MIFTSIYIIIYKKSSENIEDQDQDDGDEGDRVPCCHCDRKFKEEAIEKHEKICKKIFCTQRKKFDMKKKRVLDSEHAMILKRNEKQGNNNNNALAKAKDAKKQKWKKMSEEFRAILKANNTTTGFGSTN